MTVSSRQGAQRATGRELAADARPGLITGVADDDPSGIATYSQAGAQFGSGCGRWVPGISLMAAVQLMCARIGRVTGQGLSANIQGACPAPVLRAVVVLLLVANTLNIAADIATWAKSPSWSPVSTATPCRPPWSP